MRWTCARSAAGEQIFAQGDIGYAMYIVASGDINIFLPGEESRRVSLKDIGRGEFFGELALFDEKPRSASALATTDAVLYELKRATLAAYLEQHPRAAMAILRTMSGRMRETNALLHARVAKNVDEEFDRHLSWSDHLADKVAALNGSWRFIIFLIALTAFWCIGNSVMMARSPPDPYPYQFFNLALGILVGLQGPLIVMSQNRQARKDRARADTDFKVNLKNEVNIETLLRELSEFRTEMADRRAAGRLSQHEQISGRKMGKNYLWIIGGVVFAALAWAAPAATNADAEIAALRKELAELKKSAYHPELGEQMLTLQIRHARLWFAGKAQNWTLAAFELQEIKEAFDAVVEQNPEHAIFQPQRLADILPAMIKAPVTALRDAIDHGSKAEFDKAYDVSRRHAAVAIRQLATISWSSSARAHRYWTICAQCRCRRRSSSSKDEILSQVYLMIRLAPA